MSSIESAPATIPRPAPGPSAALAAPRLVDPDVLGNRLLQPGPLGELQDRCETGARHQVGIFEDGVEAVTDSHPTDALLCFGFVTFAGHILLAQQGIRASRPADHLTETVDPGLAGVASVLICGAHEVDLDESVRALQDRAYSTFFAKAVHGCGTTSPRAPWSTSRA
jgi:hypothetical protein